MEHCRPQQNHAQLHQKRYRYAITLASIIAAYQAMLLASPDMLQLLTPELLRTYIVSDAAAHGFAEGGNVPLAVTLLCHDFGRRLLAGSALLRRNYPEEGFKAIISN